MLTALLQANFHTNQDAFFFRSLCLLLRGMRAVPNFLNSITSSEDFFDKKSYLPW